MASNGGSSPIEWLIVAFGLVVSALSLLIVLSPFILLLALAYWLVKQA